MLPCSTKVTASSSLTLLQGRGRLPISIASLLILPPSKVSSFSWGPASNPAPLLFISSSPPLCCLLSNDVPPGTADELLLMESPIADATLLLPIGVCAPSSEGARMVARAEAASLLHSFVPPALKRIPDSITKPSPTSPAPSDAERRIMPAMIGSTPLYAMVEATDGVKVIPDSSVAPSIRVSASLDRSFSMAACSPPSCSLSSLPGTSGVPLRKGEACGRIPTPLPMGMGGRGSRSESFPTSMLRGCLAGADCGLMSPATLPCCPRKLGDCPGADPRPPNPSSCPRNLGEGVALLRLLGVRGESITCFSMSRLKVLVNMG
mmetsp:Transcript_18836/g.43493  ORF Transcript_18836/g.43493 Transcript_18836/m.43493 type:complete len:321 (+) Transcript_18836:168-1130(+)